MTTSANKCVASLNEENTFNSFYKGVSLPVFADFKASTIEADSCRTISENAEKKQRHEIRSFGVELVCSYDGKFSNPIEVKMQLKNFWRK